MRSGRVAGASVPRSCIESAEFIIQCYVAGHILSWQRLQSREPHIIALFGGGKSYNVTDTQDFHNLVVSGLEDYHFTSMPTVGEGLICVNKTSEQLDYNMHAGAVIGVFEDETLISNMMEPFGVPVNLTTLQTISIRTPQDFRSLNLDDADKYALGLLKPK
jgi:hypothetical protein